MTDAIANDKGAPMVSAPIIYSADGSVDWGNMWDSFCALSQDGGPPHRASMLHAQTEANPHTPAYQAITAEIIRGITAVSGLTASPSEVGWISVFCPSSGMADWLCDAINQENVQARAEGNLLFVPTGEDFSIKGEVKNVITAVAKTTHYWQDHVPAEVKLTLGLQARLARLMHWLGQRRG